MAKQKVWNDEDCTQCVCGRIMTPDDHEEGTHMIVQVGFGWKCVDVKPKAPIDSNEFYLIYDSTYMCCDQSQFQYVCKAHEKFMGCMFCEFEADKPCDC